MMEDTMIMTDYFLGMVFGEVNQFTRTEDVVHVARGLNEYTNGLIRRYLPKKST